MARPREFDIDQALDRATELFWTKGYEETSLSDLEEGLGVGRQSLYSTFGDKHDLFLAALDRYAAAQRERLSALLSSDAGIETIRTFFRTLVEYLASQEPRRSCMMVNSVVAFGRNDAAVSRRCTANRDSMTAAFRHALEGAARLGELRPAAEPAALALFLVSQVYGMVLLAREGSTHDELSRVANTALSGLAV
jgi:TetR/AcrR family transcriptional repressor of nem operon